MQQKQLLTNAYFQSHAYTSDRIVAPGCLVRVINYTPEDSISAFLNALTYTGIYS